MELAVGLGAHQVTGLVVGTERPVVVVHYFSSKSFPFLLVSKANLDQIQENSGCFPENSGQIQENFEWLHLVIEQMQRNLGW